MDKNINQPDQLLAEIIEAWYKFQDLMPEDETSDTTEYLKQEGRVATLIHKAEQFLARPAEAPASSGHTPGPWRKAMPAYPKGDSIDGLWKCPIEHRPDDIMPAVAYGASKEEAEANAELIARAPMLERELQKVKDQVTYHKLLLDTANDVAAEYLTKIGQLQKFKDYVHKRLDDAGIEKEPNGEHSKHGCRIGDRLDILLDLVTISENEQLLKELQEARAALEFIKNDGLPTLLSDAAQKKLDAVLSSPHDTQKL